MRAFKFLQLFNVRELRIAWFVAIAADTVQIVLLPLYVAGGLSPLDTFVDLATAVILTRLIGWHWAFLPTILAELTPGLDLFPTWTAAVLYVTWQWARFEPAGPPPPQRSEESVARPRPWLPPAK